MNIHIKDLMNCKNWRRYLLDLFTQGHIRINFSSNETTFENVRLKRVLINMFILQVKYHFNQPITELPIGDDAVLSVKTFEKELVKVYLQEIILPDGTFREDDLVYEEMSEQMWKVANQILNFTNSHCRSYTRSVDIVGVAKFKNSEAFKKAIPIAETDFDHMTVKEAEDKENEFKKKMMNLITTTDNPFKPFVRLGMLNQDQIYDSLGSIGYKTDINDKIVKHYIKSNYADGIDCNASYVAESLAARKAAFYNSANIQTSRYFERKVQLISSFIRCVYPGDCGTELTIPYFITKANKSNCVGKFIVDNGREILLLDNNIDNYVGKTVNLRSAITCRHVDGVCSKCSGLLTKFYPKSFNLGLVASIHAIEPVSQRIMSAKHFQNVQQVNWNPENDSIKQYFNIVGSMIFISSYGREFQLVVDSDTVKTFINVPTMYMDDNFKIDESDIPGINSLFIYKMGVFEEGPIDMKSTIKPRFSSNFVKYYRRNPECIKILTSGLVMIDAKDFPADEPIMEVDMINDSMMAYFRSVSQLFESDLSKLTSCSQALEYATDVIWKKVNINIMFVEILLKAHMITDTNDYRIPSVVDPDNVMFGKLRAINMFRSLSVSLTHEQHMTVFTNRDFYKPLVNSDYDVVPIIEGY